jgi:hypothetical protein
MPMPVPLPLPALLAAASLAACSAPPPGTSVPVPDTAERIHYYPAPIAAFAPDDAGPYRVTVRDTATPDTLAALDRLAAGAEPLPRADDRTLVYRFTAEQRRRAAGLPFVAAIAVLQPAERIAPALAGAAGRVEVVIDLFPGSPARQRAVADLVARWGGQVRDRRPGTLRASLDGARLIAVAGISEVRWIEPGAMPSAP